VPAATPVVTPDAVIVATAVLLLLHTPPETLLLIEAVEPAHIAVVPATADGSVLTVTVLDEVHPVGSIYVMDAVPVATVVNVPADGSITATEPLPLVQVPPEDASVSVVVAPAHKDVVPPMAAGDELTITGAETLQDPML